jgi:hypothetical protein
LIEEEPISLKTIKRLTWIVFFSMRFEEWVTHEVWHGFALNCTKSGRNYNEFIQKSARKWRESEGDPPARISDARGILDEFFAALDL